MIETYTRGNCLSWLAHPDVDPLTQQSLIDQKETFKQIITACRYYLKLEDIAQHNPDLLNIIFPNQNDAIPDQDIIHQLQTPSLIRQLLRSEHSWLTRKAKAYTHLVKIHGPDQTFLDSLTQINHRLTQLDSVANNCSVEKQSQLLEWQTHVARLIDGDVRSFMYQMIIQFAQTSHLILNCCLVGGQQGTGIVAQLLAQLYHKLGLLRRPVVTYGFSIEHLESLIIVPINALHMDYLTLTHQLYGICVTGETSDYLNIPLPLKPHFPQTINVANHTDRDRDQLDLLFDNILRSRLSYQHTKI
uniref:Uncharacterized protein n=1 Tax=viral metagenome TaxID=1070528 RepID=A0A6C0BJW4_9ZZZZ